MRHLTKSLLIFSILLSLSAGAAFATEIVGFDEYGYLDQYGNYIDDEANYNPQINYEQYLSDNDVDYSPDLLTGDTKLACEAILCLSSGNRPSECSPSLSRYFSIKKKKWSNTIKARLNFLKLCPMASDDPAVASLLQTLSNIGGTCDAEGLNDSGGWVTETTNIGSCYGTQNKNVQGIAEGTGKAYSITYTEDNDGNCTKTLKYWKVNSQASSECMALWNHAYTYYEDQPKLVYGQNPWDTHWVE